MRIGGWVGRIAYLSFVLACAGCWPNPLFDAPARFEEGDVLEFADIDALEPFVPEELWEHREWAFYEGMRLEIGPPFRDYSPAIEFIAATARFAREARIGPDGSLLGYTAGAPFATEKIDCRGDPDAGSKLIWNFVYRWAGPGSAGTYLYTYWDRGKQLPHFYAGTHRTVHLSPRVESRYLDRSTWRGEILPADKRRSVSELSVLEPFSARGVRFLSYRYKSADLRRSAARKDDTWYYVPTLRRISRVPSAHHHTALAGTDFSFDDFHSFAGIVPRYEWTCLGRLDLIAPMNTKRPGYPYVSRRSFGPLGLSFASDRWELRHAIKVRMKPKASNHPYAYKDLYIDEQTLQPLYAFAYDHRGALWKIIWHNHRWSEDDHGWDEGKSSFRERGDAYFPGWEGVSEPRVLSTIAEIITNVQTGTGNRIEIWDAAGVPFASKAKLRRFVDVWKLKRGR